MTRENNPAAAKLGLESLTVGYRGVPLISDITLSLAKGEIMTLIGPNGSGKSTILKSITQHLAAIAGTVYIDGKNMRTLSGRDIATKLAVVLTERVRPELMTCRELVSAGRYPYTGSFGLLTAHDKEVVERSLARVHAEDIADQDVTAISDGQHQRVLLARAICQEPEIIVLDEPTSFLDIRHKIELLGILSDMAKHQGISVVMSLHEIDLAERISDRIVCVKGDRIAAYGTPDEIFSDDTIAALYGIENGSFNTLLGSVELAAPRGRIRCFAVGGCGCGIPFYRALQKRGIPFAAGILPENDLDMAAASPLAEKVVASAAYMPIGEREIAEARQIIGRADFVIDCGCPAGEYNRANADLILYAREEGKRVYTSLRELPEA
ncbi:MAG: ABC transporter ATP-binding protein [Clostridia bacterium]|nr:ABC transporter ATP-binding protein [Clostridia bacterium]